MAYRYMGREKETGDSVTAITAAQLCALGRQKHGKTWHDAVAVKIGVHRTTVLRWASGASPIRPIAQKALRKHFRI